MIYIDKPMFRLGRTWAHLSTDDDDLEELHLMAYKLGLKRAWFQPKEDFPHYDVSSAVKRQKAITLGAKLVSPQAMVTLVLQPRRAKRLARLTKPSESVKI